MKNGFRQSMAWLHTWAGLVPGWLLYFIFVTGTIGYFFPEIDRWMVPERAMATPRVLPLSQLLEQADAFLREEAPAANEWWIRLPVARHETDLRAQWVVADPERGGSRRSPSYLYDASADRFILPQERNSGGGFALYVMHERLYYLPSRTGQFIVFVCALVMLVGLLSGIITHRKIFQDFFTFRRGTDQRSWLDAHNLAGVLALPFLLMITFTGLVYYVQTFLPAPVQAIYGGDTEAYYAESNFASDYNRRPGAEQVAPLLPLAGFLDAAKAYWGDTAEPWAVQVFQPDDRNAEVRLWHSGQGLILRYYYEQLHFDGVDGTLIRQVTADASTARKVDSVLESLHEAVFAGPLLRWLYFLAGVLGCVMIASGLILWTVKRRRKKESGSAGFGFRLVECLNIGTIAGLLVAVAAYFWASRLLPVALVDRDHWEIHCLFFTWAAMFVYAALRKPERAWTEELAVAALLFGLLPLLNALTTDRHLGFTLPAGDWALAGVDLTALAAGVALAIAAVQLHGRCASDTPTKIEIPEMPPLPEIPIAMQKRTRYRWSVAARVAAATIGGYGLTSLFTAALATLLFQSGLLARVDAALTAMMVGLVVCALTAMAVFRARSATNAWTWLGIFACGCAAIAGIWSP